MLLNISYSWHSCIFHGKHLFKALHTFYWGDICLFCFWWVKEHCLFYRLDYNWPCRICTWELFVLTRFAFLYTWCTKGFILATVNSHTFSSTACTSGVTSKNPLPSSERLRTDFLPSFMSQLWNVDHWTHFCQWYNTGFNFTPLGAVSHFQGGVLFIKDPIPLDDLGVLLQIKRPYKWGGFFFNVWAFWCIHYIIHTQPRHLSLHQDNPTWSTVHSQ